MASLANIFIQGGGTSINDVVGDDKNYTNHSFNANKLANAVKTNTASGSNGVNNWNSVRNVETNDSNYSSADSVNNILDKAGTFISDLLQH